MRAFRVPKQSVLTISATFVLIISWILVVAGIGTSSEYKVAGTPFPVPTSQGTPTSTDYKPVYRLVDHPLLVSHTPLTIGHCALPNFGVSDAELSAYYAAGIACLNATWEIALRASNLPFTPPQLDAAPDLSAGPCGNAPDKLVAVAYYCSGNHTVYMPTKRLRESPGGTIASRHLATLAHEYGHHVQALTGLLRAANEVISNTGERSTRGLEMSRRIELQANCFAGMFFAAVADRGSIGKQLARESADDFQYAIDQPPEQNDHGTAANQDMWAKTGFNTNIMSACNTYSADPEKVR